MSITSPWHTEESERVFPALNKGLETDTVVIGGGICGVTTAYLLAKQGTSVALVEKGRIGGGETGYTTAFLSKEIELALPQLVRKHGEAKAKNVWQAGQSAIDEIARIVKAEKIDCELALTDARAFPSDDQGSENLREEVKIAKRLGFEAEFDAGVMRLGGEGRFHVAKFLKAIADKAVASGAKLYEKTTALSLSAGEKIVVKTKSGTIKAKRAIIATHQPDKKLVAYDFGLMPYHTFAIETRIPSGLIEGGTYWDTLKPFHYWRVDAHDGYDRLILGGEDTAEKPDPKKAHAALLAFAKQLTKRNDLTIERGWGGQLYDTADGLPIIGEVPGMKDVFVGTGFSGNGMTFGVLTAMMASDGSLHDRWSQVFSPRVPR